MAAVPESTPTPLPIGAPALPKNLTPLVDSLSALNAFLLTDAAALHVLLFGAPWDEPSRAGGAMDALLAALAALHPGARFGRVEAESEAGGADVAAQFAIAAVPTFLYFRAKQLVDRLEGADAAAVTQRAEKWARAAAAAPGAAGAAPAAVPRSLVELEAEIERLVSASPVMVFIKGSPSEPRCKFSRQLLEVLRLQNGGAGVAFGSFDILSNEAIRQGLKDKFAWPTFPMLVVNGKLVGGVDIVKELHENGELAAVLPSAPAAPSASASASAPTLAAAQQVAPPTRAELDAIVSRSAATVFIKGSADAPACGFSASILETLRGAKIDFEAFDVLSDLSVREALKSTFAFSTYPQLFVRGALVGNCETLRQLIEGDGSGGGGGVGLDGLAAALRAPTLEPLQDKLRRLSTQRPVVLFMKGTAAEPRCGFSARAIELLRDCGVDTKGTAFASVDILADDDVRQGMKAFSNWPTFPQLYVASSFVGGLDILNEMKAEGELQALLKAVLPQ